MGVGGGEGQRCGVGFFGDKIAGVAPRCLWLEERLEG